MSAQILGGKTLISCNKNIGKYNGFTVSQIHQLHALLAFILFNIFD